MFRPRYSANNYYEAKEFLRKSSYSIKVQGVSGRPQFSSSFHKEKANAYARIHTI